MLPLGKSFVKFPRGVLLNTAILVLTCREADSVTSKENYNCCEVRIAENKVNDSQSKSLVIGPVSSEVQTKDAGVDPRNLKDIKDLEKRIDMNFDLKTVEDTDREAWETDPALLGGINEEESVILDTSLGQSHQGLNAFATLRMCWVFNERNGIGPRRRNHLTFGFRVANLHGSMCNTTKFELFVQIPLKGRAFHLKTDFRISTVDGDTGKRTRIWPTEWLSRMADTDYILDADCVLVLAVLKCCLILLPLILILVYSTFKRTFSWVGGYADDLVAQLRRLNDSLERFNP